MTAKKSSSKKKTATVKAVETEIATVVGSSVEDSQKQDLNEGADTVTIAVSLRGGHIFDDIPNGTGGTKKVALAGLDDGLRGKKGGILTADGNAVYQTLARSDWEAILAIHGKETMFLGKDGHSPCVFEIESASAAKKGVYKDEISNMATGIGPIDPKSIGVSESDK